MFIDELYLEEIREEVIKLLKGAGIKHGLKKQDLKPEYDDDVKVYKVFQTSLGLLEKERVATAHRDHFVEVPVFVIDACQFIKKDLTVEGLFRKAGSAAKQRELKILLDSGNRLDLNDDQSIINVANTLKMFFRELPEPLIPHKFHSLFLRCLNCKGNHVQAVLWACLLLPLSHLHTLAYLMQFLSEVSQQSPTNKMDESNLSIIFTPTLMPVNSRKLTAQGGAMIHQRMKIIQILLKNSSKIGEIPEGICERLGLCGSHSFSSADDLDSSIIVRKRRKKRSSSLNRVISGIKKMISKTSPDTVDGNAKFAHTPKIMSNTKMGCAGSNFSNRKKLTVLKALPNHNLLANTPQKVKYCSTSMLTPRTIVTRFCLRKKDKLPPLKRREILLNVKWTCITVRPESNKVVRNNSSAERKRKISHSDDAISAYSENFINECVDVPVMNYNCEDRNEEFVSVRKDEFIDIKKRVSLLESKFQNELNFMSMSDGLCGSQHGLDVVSAPFSERVSAPFSNEENELMSVDDAFNHAVQESQRINASSHNPEFEVRKTQRPIRSPSARKIGSFRNRRRVSRHSSLNLCDRPARSRYQDDVFSSKRLRRGRPNTVFSGLPVPPQPFLTSETNLSADSLDNTATNFKPEPTLAANPSKIDKWPTSRILKEDQANQSRRSSINIIRQRNAGMVLQKAKLFGDVREKCALADAAESKRNACVHTPSPHKALSPRPLVQLNNVSNLRTPRIYRTNFVTLSHT